MRVRVYRNLNNGKLSIKDRKSGLILGHCTAINLHNVELIVSESGSKRVKETGARNVHAFVEGDASYIVGFESYKNRECFTETPPECVLHPSACIYVESLTYNPHKHNFFVTREKELQVLPKWDCAFITHHGKIHVGNLKEELI